MQGFVDDLLDECFGLPRAFAAARSILLDPGNPLLRKPASPQAYRLGTAAKFARNLLVEQPGRGQQRDPGPQHQSRRRRTSARPALQNCAVAV